MNVLILGNGARAHVIAETISKSTKVKNIFVIGMEHLNKHRIHNIKSEDSFDDILTICKIKKIDLVVVGPEKYLVNGITDFLNKHDIKCFGPNKRSSNIEGSKSFSKKLMSSLNILTPSYHIFDNYLDAKKLFMTNGMVPKDFVIKVSGLACGKGVFLPNSHKEMLNVLKEIFIEKRFGDSGNKIIVEERLNGIEVSILGFCNGSQVELMPQTKDYKRIYDEDIGLNTGGMGSHCPVNILNDKELRNIKNSMEKIVKKLNYKGVLYAGVMKTFDGEVHILEFNCRFGDPEAQVILNLLESDLVQVMLDCINKKRLIVKWKSSYVSNIVLSHENYPISKLETSVTVSIGDLDEDIKLYFNNVSLKNNRYLTTGGRVMSVVYCSNNYYDSINKIYNNIHKIKYDGVYFRRDIGLKYLMSNSQNLSRTRIAIIGSTNGTSCVKLMDKINKSELNAEVEVIVSNRKKSGILDKAKKYGVSFIYLPFKKGTTCEKYDEQMVNILRAYDIDLVFLIGYMRIVSSVFINEFEGNLLNIHPSLLPKYDGLMDLQVHKKIIENNDKFSGCTLHLVSEKVDGGRIMLQKQCVVKTKSPIELKKKIQELEADCIIDFVKIYGNFKINYKVNIDLGDKFVETIKKDNKLIGGFCSTFNYKNMTLAAATDGVGTKLDLADEFGTLGEIGIDLVAMNVNDLMACGGKPLFFMDYIAIDKMNIEKCSKIIKGINKGCEISGCKLIGGETAEMSGIYMKNKYDLCGFVVGCIENPFPKLDLINDKCVLYGIKSSGIHSNGYTLVRKLLKKYPNEIDIKKILEPTKIYTELMELWKLGSILGMAHITGGGFKNINRILPNELTYKLKDWKFPEIFRWIEKKSGLNRSEMLNTFNCGIGIVLVVKKNMSSDTVTKFNLIEIGEIITKM